MTTLFVNSCIRGEESRTLQLCREYLERLDASEEVEEMDLAKMRLVPLDAERVEYRADLQVKGDFDDPIFDISKRFASADHIVIGAPYWDLSFPAALKVLIEHASVCDIAFHYTEDARCEGLCNAKDITYISTCGGFVDGADFGYEYICGIANMFGIPEVRRIQAEGLDVVGIDIEERMDLAREQMEKLLTE